MSKEKREFLEEHDLDRERCVHCNGTGRKPEAPDGEGDAVARPEPIVFERTQVDLPAPDLDEKPPGQQRQVVDDEGNEVLSPEQEKAREEPDAQTVTEDDVADVRDIVELEER